MEREYLWTSSDFEIVDGCLWFVPTELNVLVQYELETESILDVFALDNEISIEYASYNVKKIYDNIVVLPGRSNNLYMLDRDHNIKKEKVDEVDTKKDRYQPIVECDNKTLCIPISADSIIVFDEGKKIEFVPFEKRGAVQALHKDSKIYLFNGEGDIRWMSSETYCVTTEKTSFIKDAVCGIDCGSEIAFLLKNGKVFMCDSNNVEEGREIVCATRGDYYATGARLEDNIILFPNNNYDKLCVYNIKQDKTMYVETDIKRISAWNYNSFSGTIMRCGFLWVFSLVSQELLKIDRQGVIVSRYRILANELTSMLTTEQLFADCRGQLLRENGVYKLSSFLEYIYSD